MSDREKSQAAGRPFEPEKSFFVLDSEHLEETESALYGFTLIGDRIVERLEDLQGEEPGLGGAWVYVNRKANAVTVSQDFIGSDGLYLYRQDAYFALSNSFLRLVEYLCPDRDLTLNREYADYHLMCAGAGSSVMGETLVNEITWLDRCAVAEIDLDQKTLLVRRVDYRENTVDPASPEGLEILDGWWRKWCSRFRSCVMNGGNLRADLSGGFDSRVTLGMLLSSGIDMNGIMIYSNTDGKHTHGEDYRIASAIASHYGFALNNEQKIARAGTHFRLDEILGISLYVKLGAHKQMYFRHSRHKQRWYTVNGYGGACIRNYWPFSEEKYIEEALKDRCDLTAVSRKRLEEMEDSVRHVLHRTFDRLREKYNACGRPQEEARVAHDLYRESRCRNHYGKSMVEAYLSNSVMFSPILDPDLQRLKLSSEVCADYDFLLAMIFARYVPDLLEFEFEGNRSFRSETLECIRQVNEAHPYRPGPFSDNGKAVWNRSEEHYAQVPRVKSGLPDAVLYSAFCSDGFRRMFRAGFDRSVYETVLRDAGTRSHHPLLTVYAAIGAACAVWGKGRPSGENASFIRWLLEHADEERAEEELAGAAARGSKKPIPQKVRSVLVSVYRRISGKAGR